MTEHENFEAFWPSYVREHAHPVSRRLHVVGTGASLTLAAALLATGLYRWLWIVPLCGYGFAWVGHFAFERNRPATFRHPLWSLRGDLRLFWRTVRGPLL